MVHQCFSKSQDCPLPQNTLSTWQPFLERGAENEWGYVKEMLSLVVVDLRRNCQDSEPHKNRTNTMLKQQKDRKNREHTQTSEERRERGAYDRVLSSQGGQGVSLLTLHPTAALHQILSSSSLSSAICYLFLITSNPHNWYMSVSCHISKRFPWQPSASQSSMCCVARVSWRWCVFEPRSRVVWWLPLSASSNISSWGFLFTFFFLSVRKGNQLQSECIIRSAAVVLSLWTVAVYPLTTNCIYKLQRTWWLGNWRGNNSHQSVALFGYFRI